MKVYLSSLKKTIMLIIFAGIIQHGLAQINSKEILSPTKPDKHLSNHVGLGIETYLNGDSHGWFCSMSLQMQRGRTIVGIGPCLQNHTGEINGGKLRISYFLSGLNETYEEDNDDPSDVVELRALFNLQYTGKAKMSYCASEVETLTNPESTINYYDLRFNTITATLAPEIDYNLKKVRIRTYAGVSFFYHLNYPELMYRPKCGPALVLGIGVSVPKL